MLAPDVNVLVSAYRKDAAAHATSRSWLASAAKGDEPIGLSSLVAAGFLRIVTHPRVFNPPSPRGHALDFLHALRAVGHCLPLEPGPRHWDIFVRLCDGSDARGNLVPDAYLAALAIEAGAEWVTFDRDFSRFVGLRWRTP